MSLPVRFSFVVVLLTAFVIVFALLAQTVFGQASGPNTSIGQDLGASDQIGIANFVPIQEKEKVPDGAIISFTQQGFVLASIEYDPHVRGVMTENPSVMLEVEREPGMYPVVERGTVDVRVSTANGPIKVNDLVTTSKTPGVGMKATLTGFVIGKALENYDAKDPKTVGKIAVTLDIRSVIANAKDPLKLNDILNLTTVVAYQDPVLVFKYLVAGLVIILSFIIGFVSFGRVASVGVAALGRNPLAGKTIQFGIMLNVMITIAIVGAGFGLAYFILKL